MQTRIGESSSVAIVDTPGFDDTERSDAEILTLITSFLMTQYQLGIPLKGVIYLHRITDPKMQGHALRNFRMFERICGDNALSNVVLLTTMWDKLRDEVEGLNRDQELREDFWSLMEEKGSYIARSDGSKEMAEAMIAMLLEKDSVVLEIQRELHEKKRLHETAAGQIMLPELQSRMSETDEYIRSLEARIREAERQRDKAQAESLEKQRRAARDQRRRDEVERRKLEARIAGETEEKIREAKKKSRWQSGIQIFVTVTGVAVSIVANLLPLFGFGI